MTNTPIFVIIIIDWEKEVFKINKEQAIKIANKIKKRERKSFNQAVISSLEFIDRKIKRTARKGNTKLLVYFEESDKYKNKYDRMINNVILVAKSIFIRDFKAYIIKHLISRGFFVYTYEGRNYITIDWEDEQDRKNEKGE